MKTASMLLGGLAVAVALGFLAVGCDPITGLDGLIVEPSYKELTAGEHVVELSVMTDGSDGNTNTVDGETVARISGNELGLPLTWRVTDPELGVVSSRGGTRAVYVRSRANGLNTVIVRDQYDNEGFATIRQTEEQYGLTLTADPNPIPAGTIFATIQVGGHSVTGSVATAGAGQAPFVWTVMFPHLGNIIAGQGTRTAIYAGVPGSQNVVQCRDDFGVVGTILIEQRTAVARSIEVTRIRNTPTGTVLRATGRDRYAPAGPFRWTVYRPQFGAIVAGQGTDTATFSSQVPEWNIVQVRDRHGVVGAIFINRTAE